MLRKTWYYLRRQGLRRTLELILAQLRGSLRGAWYALCFFLRWPGGAKRLRARLAGQTVLVILPTVEWGFLFARAQQIAAELGWREGCTAIYLTRQRTLDRVCGWEEVRPGVILANAALAGRLDRVTGGAKTVIASVFDLRSAGLLARFRHDRLVYEYVDDLHLLVSGADDFSEWARLNRSLLARADLAVASAGRLYDQIAPYAAHALLLPNAADYDFFSAPAAPDGAVQALRTGFSCVIGYYGALADWFDYEAVKKAARARPDWRWVLVGSAIGPALENSGILKLPNVTWLPAAPYAALPSYLAAMDVMTIPFARNEITEAVSPVKLFEYLAAGKPVVSADLPECRRYPPVRIYHSASELVEQIGKALADRENPETLALLRQTARENTWAARVDAELSALGLMNKKN